MCSAWCITTMASIVATLKHRSFRCLLSKLKVLHAWLNLLTQLFDSLVNTYLDDNNTSSVQSTLSSFSSIRPCSCMWLWKRCFGSSRGVHTLGHGLQRPWGMQMLRSSVQHEGGISSPLIFIVVSTSWLSSQMFIRGNNWINSECCVGCRYKML